MNVTFWGVRGSIPAPGASTARWGGNSSCVEVRHGDLDPIVLDCGTGARGCGDGLVRSPHRAVDLLFSHLHMDHLFGLPFFLPMYTPGFEVRIGVPAYTSEEARDKLARYLNGIYHPVRLRDMPARLTFEPMRPGSPTTSGGFTVRSAALSHPGGALGYRIEHAGAVFVYVTDTAPFARPGEGLHAGQPATTGEEKLLALIAGADLVAYDTMYELDEYLDKMTFGHSYPEYAVSLCAAAGVKKLALFHHSPEADDDTLDARAARWAGYQGPMEVVLAREGLTIEVTRAPAGREAVGAEG